MESCLRDSNVDGSKTGGKSSLTKYNQRIAGKSENLLVGLLLGLAKLAIDSGPWTGVNMANCLPLFRGDVCAQVSLEKEHAVSTSTLDVFREKRALR
eukprot:g33136.t1